MILSVAALDAHQVGLTASRIALYATVATVFPILMLAFSLQFRTAWLIRGTKGPPLGQFFGWCWMVIGMLLVLAMAWDEFEALASLAENRSDGFNFVMGA